MPVDFGVQSQIARAIQKNDREVLFRLPKYRSFHKDWIHATGRQFDNLPSKIFICQTNLKKSALISDGNFKMDCTVKSFK